LSTKHERHVLKSSNPGAAAFAPPGHPKKAREKKLFLGAPPIHATHCGAMA
jgi:hypothetical protein